MNGFLQEIPFQPASSPTRSDASSNSDSSDSLDYSASCIEHQSSKDNAGVTSNRFDEREAEKFGYLLQLLPKNGFRSFSHFLNVNWDSGLGYYAVEQGVQKIITALQRLELHEDHERESVLESFEPQYEYDVRREVAFIHLALYTTSMEAMATDSVTSSSGTRCPKYHYGYVTFRALCSPQAEGCP